MTPARTCRARSRNVKLQGETSVQVWTTATSGLAMAAPSSPVARNMARAGARAGPCLLASLLIDPDPGWYPGRQKQKPRTFSGAESRFFRPGFGCVARKRLLVGKNL